MPKRPITPDDLYRIILVGDPQISPDGSRILFTRKTIDREQNAYLGHLWTVDTDGGNPRQWTQGKTSASMGRWSFDGRHIAFVSGRNEKIPQIFVLSSNGGEATSVTELEEGSIASIAWSPDGRYIAFSYRPTNENWTQRAKKDREAKNLSIPPREIDDMWYRLDGDGYFLDSRYGLYVVEVETSRVSKVYTPNPRMDSFSFDWNPNSEELIVTDSVAKNPIFDLIDDRLFRVDLSGQAVEVATGNKGPKGAAKWSPDGNWIAYVGNVGDSYGWDARNDHLYVVASEGGQAKDLSSPYDYCLATGTLSDTKEASFDAPLSWLSDSSGLLVQLARNGRVNIGQISLEGKLEEVTTSDAVFAFGAVSRQGAKLGVLRSDPEHLAEVGVLELATKNVQMLTQFNRGYHEEIETVRSEEFWIESEDGHRVHGWLIKPVGYLAPKRYPAILEVHGGPHAQYGCTYFHEFQVLAAEGYAVFFSNPRGSKGYGEAHCAAISGDWGKKDWMDIQAVTRYIQHQNFVHPGQIGIMGGSYGGYMTNWAIGHSKDYRAAITDRCVSNMVSMAGSSDFPFAPGGYFPGVAFGDLEDIRKLWEQSPIAYFKGVDTPTLIIHSEGDLRCNVEQSEQVFAALQAQGVPSRFVRYPQTTSHGMSRSGPPDLRIHRLNEITRWWERWLKGNEA